MFLVKEIVIIILMNLDMKYVQDGMYTKVKVEVVEELVHIKILM